MSKHEISFDPSLSDSIRTQADFTYNITPAMISIADTGLGKCPVTERYRGSLAKDRALAPGLNCKFKIVCRDGKGFWHGVRWDDKTASFFALQESNEIQFCI